MNYSDSIIKKDDEDDINTDSKLDLNLNSKHFIKKIIEKQLKNIKNEKKLLFKDVKRICKNISGDLFHPDNCSIWKGNVTYPNNSSKGKYINFYFRGKKSALHRLLYSNFVESLSKDEYLKFKCNNKGICCNIHHLQKFKYHKIKQPEILINKKDSEFLIEKKTTSSKNNKKLILIFD